MMSVKLLVCVIMTIISSTLAADTEPSSLLKNVIPTIMQKYYNLAPTQTGYHLVIENPNGSIREEMQMILNPGTPEQETVVMGMYTVYDDKTDTETVTMYTADKNGYRPRITMKRKVRSANLNKSLISR
ncbi:hypothetical protein FF38_13542 [Lucilia cuprina]|uniref:Larval cuticle protein 5 n=1 Tax=Lucilia cuprina TaxID=7375 RepID=A0A0L0BPW7_LUCCU|nr:hypothetical protein CVS40_7936 [Lucilia cuprina]KNC22102.1 hypothetical protein FF38_13542 [Lucilia cuprina]